MMNNIGSFLKEYKEKGAKDADLFLKQEMYVFILKEDGSVVSNYNCGESDECEKFDSLGEAMRCYDMEEDIGCGKGKLCGECPLRAAIDECFRTKKSIIKKNLSKRLSYKGVRNERKFRLSTFFPYGTYDEMLIILDDVTIDYQNLELHRIEKYLRESIQTFTYDSMIEYCIDQVSRFMTSEFVVLYMIDKSRGFGKDFYMSGNMSAFSSRHKYEDLIERKLWLQCINEKEVLIDNHYHVRVQRGFKEPVSMDVHRVLLCPVMDMDKVIGIIVVGNKPLPYNVIDKETVRSFAKSVINLVIYKKDIENMRRDRQMQANLAETVDIGLFRFISSDGNHMTLDYMNDAVMNLFALNDQSSIGKADFFLRKMDDSCVKSYLIARDVAIQNNRAFKWSGAFNIDGKRCWMRIHMSPAHLDDRGLCWEGSVCDISQEVMKSHSINQIREQLEHMIRDDTYTTDGLLALLADLKTTVNQ